MHSPCCAFQAEASLNYTNYTCLEPSPNGESILSAGRYDQASPKHFFKNVKTFQNLLLFHVFDSILKCNICVWRYEYDLMDIMLVNFRDMHFASALDFSGLLSLLLAYSKNGYARSCAIITLPSSLLLKKRFCYTRSLGCLAPYSWNKEKFCPLAPCPLLLAPHPFDSAVCDHKIHKIG